MFKASLGNLVSPYVKTKYKGLGVSLSGGADAWYAWGPGFDHQ